MCLRIRQAMVISDSIIAIALNEPKAKLNMSFEN